MATGQQQAQAPHYDEIAPSHWLLVHNDRPAYQMTSRKMPLHFAATQ